MKPGLPIGFRGDIQGLRAFAVLAVLVNHAFPSALPGGFTGVDVFFTISGYLIGKHLLISLQDGSFSLSQFYAKRARRIFPALTVMLFTVWGLAYIYFMAPDFAKLGKHMAVSAIFSNNIILWTESGYFDSTALSKPLLHLWSLGIEEQFYLLAPCLLWVGLRFERRPMAWIIRLGVLSLLFMLFFSAIYPAPSFYLIHSRFWELAAGVAIGFFELKRKTLPLTSDSAKQKTGETSNREIQLLAMLLIFAVILLLGSNQAVSDWDTLASGSGLTLLLLGAAIVAIHATRGDRSSALQTDLVAMLQRHWASRAEAFALLGFAILCFSAIALSPRAWPGAQTLWPILGSLLIVMAPPSTVINRFLACKPMIWIGGISYPLYLWHWPLIVLWRMAYPEASPANQMIPLGTAVVLAWLTKRYVEDPVRLGRVPNNLLIFFSLSLAGLLGWVTLTTNGLPSRFPEGLRAIAEWSEPKISDKWRLGTCYHYLRNEGDFADECTPPKRPNVPLILLWGDSHAAHLYPGLISLKDNKAFDVAQWTTGSCPPTFTRIIGEGLACHAKRVKAVQMLQKNVPDTVLLSGAWELYFNPEKSQEFIQAIADTVLRLKEFGVKRVIVFGPSHTWHTSLAADLLTHMVVTKSQNLPVRFGHVAPEIQRLDAAMATQAKASKVDYFSVLNLLCDSEGCLTIGDRTLRPPDLLFLDRDHLTVTGSKLVMKGAQKLVLDSDPP